ncbi:hypothetical protein SAMN05421830_107133 [Desulfomicrobium norvegicum]|uniref:DNA-damage-inducible protein D n=1 Tax=Desulfomicrobium norvegicum (strain DSM 1741 / NCIMB 8310) TaxID=52561 RepID=A0A8G2F8D0_DESNO|nr:hypothetical protein [Desulfomicrobium norvegicum]SFL84421.1 hypothetical protein SAMN05421830_107133 [Desulfomicrobium norvegicum]
MTEKRITEQHHATFDGLRHFDEDGNEFWLARQLARILEYSEYRHFLPVIERARQACLNSGRVPEDHFEDILEMVAIGSGARRELPDISLYEQIREKEKAVKDLETKAVHSAAVFDLTAVNPNAVIRVDDRTQQEIIANIERQGRIVSEALARLAE